MHKDYINCNFENMKYGPLYTNIKLYKIINSKNAFNVLIISFLLCQKVKTKLKNQFCYPSDLWLTTI